MTLEEVLDQAILAYFAGEQPEEFNKQGESLKYTKEYFDEADSRLLPKEDLEKVKK